VLNVLTPFRMEMVASVTRFGIFLVFLAFSGWDYVCYSGHYEKKDLN